MIGSMKKFNLIFISCVFLCALSSKVYAQVSPGLMDNQKQPFFVGEKIVYGIKQFGLPVGKTTLEFGGLRRLDGRNVYLVTFTSSALNFFDEEKIYIDSVTFLPVRVERDLNIFGKKEKITEYYQPQNNIVRIVKVVRGKTTEQVIEKEGDLDNIYSFIYRYRKDGNFEIGDALTIKLPTKNVEIVLVKEGKLKAAGKSFDAYYMQSKQKEYKVWFDSGERKLPLRIDGSMGIANTSMVMQSYSIDGESSPLQVE